MGNTLHEQTANTVPDVDATPYASTLFAFGPRCRKTDSLEKKTAIAPAMNIAGTTQANVWYWAYHWSMKNDSIMAC